MFAKFGTFIWMRYRSITIYIIIQPNKWSVNILSNEILLAGRKAIINQLVDILIKNL